MATSTLDPRMAFHANQQDPGAPQPRHLIVRYFYQSGTVELMEAPSGRLYLKRTAVNIPASAFTVGSTVMLFGKATTITAFADEVTRQLCAQHSELTTVLIAEEAFPALGRYLAMLTEECRFAITDVEMVWVRPETVSAWDLPVALTNTRVVVVLCTREKAVEKGFDFVERATGTCTAKDAEQATMWGRLAELAKAKPLAMFNESNSSVVVLKPHLLSAGRGGSALQQLLDVGLEATALTTVTMSSAAAREFMEPYRGVLPDLEGTTSSFVGTSWVVQLISLDDSTSVVDTVREVCGPYDTVVAKKLYARSIRARYGDSETNNAVHCCDLPGDAPIYTKFFFQH
ncbi:Nucleoside diphosphate kinase [Novymonas esmeraldas]|uniref:Nucleoside diphosphate kinase n=1 Tax=Novymonas esmeraldas TaxID=1808958 RepID=A0AAW0ETK1_9TRYP